MTISVTCPACATRLKAGMSAAGKIKKCPRCRTAITIAGSPPAPISRPDIPEVIPVEHGFTPVKPGRATSEIREVIPVGDPIVPARSKRSTWFKVALFCCGLWVMMLLFFAVTNDTKKSSPQRPSEMAARPVAPPSVPASSSGAPPWSATPPVTLTEKGISVGVPPVNEAAQRAAADLAVQQRRQFLRQEVARLQAAIQQDNDLIQKQNWGAPAIRIGSAVLGGLLKNSSNSTDQKAAPYVPEVGGAVADEVDRARRTVEARLHANQQLLQQYQAELARLGG